MAALVRPTFQVRKPRLRGELSGVTQPVGGGAGLLTRSTARLGTRNPPQVPGVCACVGGGGPSPVREVKPCVPEAGFAVLCAVLGDLSQPTLFWGGWGQPSHAVPADPRSPAGVDACPFTVHPVFRPWGEGQNRALEMPGPLPGSVLCRPQGADTPPFRGCAHAASRACVPGVLGGLWLGLAWGMPSSC